MRIAITGANGFIGRTLYTAIVKKSQGVALINIAKETTKNVAIGDVLIDANDGQGLHGCAVLVHLAARVHVMHETEVDPLKAFRAANVQGTLNLARQAVEAGVKRFVFVSSVKVHGELTEPGVAFSEMDAPNPQDAYGVSKHEAEQGLRAISRATGMEVVIVRPPLVYGPGVKANFATLMRAVQSGWPLPLGAIHNQRSLVAIDNLVDFLCTCISHPQAANQTFLVSDGQDLSTTELVRGMAQAAGVSARLLPVPRWALQAGAKIFGKDDALQRLCGNLQVDITKARALLDWTPPISVQEGLRRVVLGAKAS